MSDDKKSYLKLKMGRKVKRLPSIPDQYSTLESYIKDSIPPFNQGVEYNLTYFDDENEAITISDDSDYEAFLSYIEEEQIWIPKLLL